MVRVVTRVALIAKPGNVATGVGRYVQTLHAGLTETRVEATLVNPSRLPLPSGLYSTLRRAGADLGAFLTNYPIWASYPEAEVYHFTSQNLATLLLIRRPPGRVVVTVHDIIPYMLRSNPEFCSYRTPADRLFDWLAIRALQRADALIADSEYTKKCVVDELGVSPEKIEVIYLAVDHERFRPLPVSSAIRERYRLPDGHRYLIYVGSEDPRKNISILIRALALLRRDHPLST